MTIDKKFDKLNDYVSDIIKQYGSEGYELYKKKYDSIVSMREFAGDSVYNKLMLKKVQFCHQYTVEVMEGKREEE